jgi:MoaA/NifB/PqqE/SkfB family radical SAM enzyme
MGLWQTTVKTLGSLGRLALCGRVPGQLVIQYTDHCNATCPQCGMRVSNPMERHTLSPEKARRIIRAAADQGIDALSFTGGEPFLFLDQLCALADYAGKCGIRYLRTGTNGFLFRHAERADFGERMERLAAKLAATPIRNIWVSIDSADPATHEQMRGLPGVIRGIEKALPIFAKHGLYLSANLGINRNFAGAEQDRKQLDYDFFYRGFERFYRFVTELGFTIANVCYPMHSEGEEDGAAVYAATASDRVVCFSRAEKLALFQGLFDCIPRQRDKIRIFTPRCSIHALLNQYRGREDLTTGCRGGKDFFFVDSRNGHAYPCGYRGTEDLGEFDQLERNRSRTASACRLCDWECFRDPSELFAPLLGLRNTPLQLLKRLRQDPDFFPLWWEDLRYYRSCQYFDGRRPPQLNALDHWRSAAPILSST